MSDYSEVMVDLSQGNTFIRGFGIYEGAAKYAFYTRGIGSFNLPKPVTTKSYLLDPVAEQRLLGQLGSFICLVEGGAQIDKTRLQPSTHPIATPDELKMQLGWTVFNSELVDPSECGLRTYLGTNAKKIPQLVLAQSFGPSVTADMLRLSATTISPIDARNIFDTLKSTI